MLTQKQIKECIPGLIDQFKAIMPPIDAPYPKIYTVSYRTQSALREELVRKTGATVDSETVPSTMEFFIGDKGTAILIYQEQLQYDPGRLRHDLWHELGHFYAVSSEKQPFHKMYAQKDEAMSAVSSEGYYLWMEFIAQTIAYYVEGHYEIVQPEDYVQEAKWWPITVELEMRLRAFLVNNPDGLDIYCLAFYYAQVLMEARTQAYIQNALDNKLLALRDGVNAEGLDEEYDYLRINTAPKIYRKPLLRIWELMYDHIHESRFWEIDEDLLYTLGLYINDLWRCWNALHSVEEDD